MNNRMMRRITVMIAAACCFILLLHNTAWAEDMAAISHIEISKQPSRTTYTGGQSLSIGDMVVTCFYQDGTSKIITDYTVEGYDSSRIGTQTINVDYKDHTAALTIKVLPPKVTNVTASGGSSSAITLTWDSIPGVKGYEVYSRNESTKSFGLAAFSETNTVTFTYAPGNIYSYYICAVAEMDGVTYTGELSDKLTAATGPEAVTGLMITKTTASSVSLTWNEVPGATGYVIYRSPEKSDRFARIGTADGTSYTDKTPASGTKYRYRVSAYSLDTAYSGTPSDAVDASTKLGKMYLKAKAGEEKIRITWDKVNGATSYDIYIGDEDGVFTLLVTKYGNNNLSYLLEDRSIGATYSFYGIAHRKDNTTTENSTVSDTVMVTLEKIEKTSTEAKLYEGVEKFELSPAYTDIKFFRENVDYDKSIIIPGLINTNIDGFTSTSMCPQGLTFAGDYLLLTAYDRAEEENSVIYVINKETKDLLTTLILPTDAHVGGISYDGRYLWVTVGSKASSLSYEAVREAVISEKPYSYVEFESENRLGVTASYITYHDNMLWVGSYNELKATKMYSYRIDYETDEVPTLKRVGSLTMPTRVQGIAFTDDGYLILSRSCQLYEGLRGYMRQLDVYRPDLANEMGKYSLGDVINTVEMPSMNEEIAIDGSFLYVNFESGAFQNASYQMDRICAFDLSKIVLKNEVE